MRKSNIDYKNFFTLFNYPKETVLLVVKTLSIYERNLLYKKYGEDFLNTTFVPSLTVKEVNEINERIIRKIRKRLGDLNVKAKIISIEDIFPGEDITDIKASMIDSNTLSYFQNLFDKELDGLCFSYKAGTTYSNINKRYIIKVNNSLKRRKGIHNIKIIRPFFSLFLKYKKSNESDEEYENRLRNIVLNMKDKYKNIIYRFYNEDLYNVILKCPGSKEERKLFSEVYSVIINKLKKDKQVQNTRKVKRYRHILTLFNEGTTLDDIKYQLMQNDKIYKLSKKKYGENLDTPSEFGTLSNEENHMLYEHYYRINGMIFREKKALALINSKNMFNSPIHKAFSEIYGFSLAYGLVLCLYFSEYLTLEEISDISNNNLEELQIVLNDYNLTVNSRKLRK